MYENTESWDSSVPADLIPAIKHLRKTYKDVHWGCGQTTERFCYACLHNTRVDDPRGEYTAFLPHMRIRLGPDGEERFQRLLKQGTPPAIFKAFLDLYLVCMTVEALRILQELIKVGQAHHQRLSKDRLEWAEAQAKHLVRYHRYLIPGWIRNVCDKRVYDPKEDIEETIHWRKWRAPGFLIMEPVRYGPYDSAMTWERKDCETSLRLLDAFADDYVIHIESKINKAVGEAALERAKEPPVRQEPENPPASNNPGDLPKELDRRLGTKRELRMLETQERYGQWRKEYQELKKRSPNMSDVWYANRIGRMDVGAGHSPDAIRKNMKG
jgi:hypothetical protein